MKIPFKIPLLGRKRKAIVVAPEAKIGEFVVKMKGIAIKVARKLKRIG